MNSFHPLGESRTFTLSSNHQSISVRMELDQYKPSTSTIIDGISVAVIFLVSLLFSISIYALFYWIWMPHAIFDYSANLHYQRDPQKGISASAVVDFSRGEFNKV